MKNRGGDVSPAVNDRLHANLVRAVIEALQDVFGNDRYADSVVKNMLKSNPKWGSKDRKFLAESVYEVVRWWRKLWFVYGKEPNLSQQDLWNVLGVYFLLSGYVLPPWKDFDEIRERSFGFSFRI